MSYGPPPPPSGGTNPYGEVPEGGSSSTPSGPSYGTPPSGPTGPQPWQTPQDAPPPPPPPGPSYGTPPPQQYGGPAQSYSPYAAQSRYPGAPGGGGYGGWINSTRDNGKATGALVMGILSIVLCFGSVLGLGLGIGAILMGNAGRRAADAGTADNRGVATAGLVLGCVGVGLSLLASLGYLSQLAVG